MTNVLQSLSQDLAGLVETAGASIVRVEARRRLPASGVIWSSDGVVVTAHHVVERDENIQIGLPDGSTSAATVVGRDPASDTAVLRVDAEDLTPAAWVEADDLRVGHLVLALGRPGHTVQATLGVISALGGPWRTPGGGDMDTYLQTDVTMYPGFSGGPLVTAGGKMAGINTSALLRGVSISVPVATLRGVVETLLAHGHMPRGYLGVGVQPVRLPDALQETLSQETGVMLMSVESDGPAAASGLLQGDVLVTLDGEPVHDIDALQMLLHSARVGKQIPVQYVRGGKIHESQVTIEQKTEAGTPEERGRGARRGRRGGR
jgi:S1-C subfamily serine protease